MVTMVCVVSRFRLKAPPVISSSCISPFTSSGQRSCASWSSQPQKSATLSPQPGGKPRKFIRTCGGIGGRHMCSVVTVHENKCNFWVKKAVKHTFPKPPTLSHSYCTVSRHQSVYRSFVGVCFLTCYFEESIGIKTLLGLPLI